MKKVLALLMALMVALCLSAPLIAIAEVSAAAPPETGYAAFVEPEDAPVVRTATENAQETDPGGIDLTELITVFISVLVAIVTRYVVPWLKARTSAERLHQIDYWYQVAVLAAEKAYGAGHGAEKLADATAFLKSKGIVVDEKIIDALIQDFFAGAKEAA